MNDIEKHIREGNFAKAIGTAALATQVVLSPVDAQAATEPAKIEQAFGSEIDMEIIKQIESGGDASATSPVGAIGLFQLLPKGAIAEWNNYHPKEQYEPKELYDVELNKKVAEWYLLKRIPQMLRHYGIKDTIENRIVAYNAGINYLRLGKSLPKETKDYLQKYEELRRR